MTRHAVLLSALFHAALAAALLIHVVPPPPRPPDYATVELIEQKDPGSGDAPKLIGHNDADEQQAAAPPPPQTAPTPPAQSDLPPPSVATATPPAASPMPDAPAPAVPMPPNDMGSTLPGAPVPPAPPKRPVQQARAMPPQHPPTPKPQPQTLQPQTLQPQTLQPQTLQPQTLQPQTAEPPTPEPAEADTASNGGGAPAAVNLGDGGLPTTFLVEHATPAELDTQVHNKAPTYPAEAARLGEEGTVKLLVHVAPDGHPLGLEIYETSGFERLDRAARDAVAHWQFRPAKNDGAPVASDTLIGVRFELRG